MKVLLASVSGSRIQAKAAAEGMAQEYVRRSAAYAAVETARFASEAELLQWVTRGAGRTPAQLVLLDARGEMLSSEELAAYLGQQRDGGTQTIVFAIGPADGWTEAARRAARKVISLGRVTLPHALAKVVLAEQVYRTLTILAGHPYHLGH